MSPFGSTVPTLEKVHVSDTHVTGLNTGTGGRLPAGSPITTSRVVLAKSPHASVTVSVTV